MWGLNYLDSFGSFPPATSGATYSTDRPSGTLYAGADDFDQRLIGILDRSWSIVLAGHEPILFGRSHKDLPTHWVVLTKVGWCWFIQPMVWMTIWVDVSIRHGIGVSEFTTSPCIILKLVVAEIGQLLDPLFGWTRWRYHNFLVSEKRPQSSCAAAPSCVFQAP